MPWHQLPPQTPEECRYRTAADGEHATCSVVRAAVPDAAAGDYRVPRSTCVACCEDAPTTHHSWNPVVGSLVYGAAASVLRGPAVRSDVRARARAAAQAALRCLETAPAEAAPPTGTVGPFKDLRALLPPPATQRPEPVRTWAVGVTTAPRVRPTLDACLDSLVAPTRL